MTFSDHSVLKDQLIASAIAVVDNKSTGEPLSKGFAVTLNFHPDIPVDESIVISNLVSDGVYHSQFVSSVSAGSLSSHKGGRRWDWEHSLFEGVYDEAPPNLRPKYGTLNYKNSSFGGAPRFGSAHLRLKSHIIERCTFAYPDSHMEPTSFGSARKMSLLALADANDQQLEPLDNYIEAHVHGLVNMNRDVEAIVLDPSYRDTFIEVAARQLSCELQWHTGFQITASRAEECIAYRGEEVAEFIQRAASARPLTPALLGEYRNGSVKSDVIKKAWHCMARYGVHTVPN